MNALVLPSVNRPFVEALGEDVRAVAGLGEVVSWAGASVLVDQSAQVSRLIRVHTDSVPPSPGDVRALGQALLSAM